MQTASLELCKALYEMSGWDDTDDYWLQAANAEPRIWRYREAKEFEDRIPAYPLGHLLRKLPQYYPIGQNHTGNDYGNLLLTHNEDRYSAGYYDWFHKRWYEVEGKADTPEDCAAKLAIELFQQGILTKGES